MTEKQETKTTQAFGCGQEEIIQQPGGTSLTGDCSGEFIEPFERIIGAIMEYHKQLGYPITECALSDRVAQHRQFCLAIHAETTELLDAVPWKPWRPVGYKPVDKVNVAEEIVDILFFCTSICEIWGIPAAMLGTMLENKLIENRRRIAIGYNKPSDEM